MVWRGIWANEFNDENNRDELNLLIRRYHTWTSEILRLNCEGGPKGKLAKIQSENFSCQSKCNYIGYQMNIEFGKSSKHININLFQVFDLFCKLRVYCKECDSAYHTKAT